MERREEECGVICVTLVNSVEFYMQCVIMECVFSLYNVTLTFFSSLFFMLCVLDLDHCSIR